ncbi:MAG TPA: beta-ketoacyl-ACP synthase [Stellaceae bacterium]|nr:beta-ketoacyl-ACP synthase [Stellaceae bacterium]
MTRRVAVTGMGGVTSLGADWPTIRGHFRQGRTGIRYMGEWERHHGVHTRLGAPVDGFDVEERYGRKRIRTMGPVARMAVYASEMALLDAGLLGDKCLVGGRTGIAYGSSFGGHQAALGFAGLMLEGSSPRLTGTGYVQMMSHTAAVNIGIFFAVTGRIVPTSSACTSGSQGIGYAYETIRHGAQDVMIAGGAEEMSVSNAAVFDTFYATSLKNDAPHTSPRPFDLHRDGLVIGEGAATLILEEWEHAKARGARIHAELVGFGTNSDGTHITQPTPDTMAIALDLALEQAGLPPSAIGFVNGHGTATLWGDVAEAEATRKSLGEGVPIHSLKSYFGHSLGACGSIEAWLGVEMMKEGWFAPTANLVQVDPKCAGLDHVMGEGRALEIEHLMSTNFAFGGINTALIFRRV